MNYKLENQVFNRLISLEKTISSAESFTGGQFISKFTRIPGASKICQGSMITYSNKSKKTLLNIKQEEIKEFGVVSKEIALKMVLESKNIFNSNISISFTGNAGPDTIENKPKGLFFIGFAFEEVSFVKKYYQPKLKRDEIISFAIDEANKTIMEYLKNI